MIAETVYLPTQQQVAPRYIDLDFLFLDLNTCTRCVGTNQNLETAIETVKPVLSLMGVDLRVNKILIESPQQAQAHRFVTSPTIRLKGRDIALDTKENLCDSCTDLCGCAEGTECRVWLYQGQEYTEAPVTMLVEVILQEVLQTAPQATMSPAHYEGVPENLQRFLASKAPGVNIEALSCCSTAEQQSCCEPAAKATCCGEVASTGSCGCQ
jgi:hypothetical protein